MNQEQLIAFISAPHRVGTLATASVSGMPNSALIGSAVMPDAQQLVMGLGNNRSLHNLQENPHAVFSVFKEAPLITAWQGARLYLQVAQIDYTGTLKQECVTAIEKNVGTQAAKMIAVAVQFSVTGIRPLVEFPKQ